MTRYTDEARYLMALSRLGTLTRADIFAALDTYGTAADIVGRRRTLPEPLARALDPLDDALRRTDAEMDFCEQRGIRILAFTEPDYPRRLREIYDPPFTLFYKGTDVLDAPRIISVIGTRRISENGKSVCQEFIRRLSSLLPDIVVISGLAYGVDIHAQRACVEHAVPTVAVLAHGLDRIYPSMHRDTAAQMTRRGGVLTEYFAGTHPDKGNFVRRNRIVAGLSDATVVVESAERGGALITARLAFESDRTVCAFPGRTTDEASVGCNGLIRSNMATLITSADDLLETMGWTAAHRRTEPVQGELFPTLTPAQEAICQRLRGSDGKSLDTLRAETGLGTAEINLQLTELEMAGVIRRLAGNAFRLNA